MAELIVFLAREERGAPAGEKESPTLCTVKNVGKRWQLILVNLAEMVSQEAKNTLKRSLPKMKTILSSGCTLYIITRAERTSPTA